MDNYGALKGSIGEYDLYRTLGDGNSCKVRIGVHQKTGESFAVKIIKN